MNGCLPDTAKSPSAGFPEAPASPRRGLNGLKVAQSSAHATEAVLAITATSAPTALHMAAKRRSPTSDMTAMRYRWAVSTISLPLGKWNCRFSLRIHLSRIAGLSP
jgi:hypothetical protein